MAALHMAGITNVLAKVDEEIPNIDGSAKDFSELIKEAGILDQNESAKDAVVLEPIQVRSEEHTSELQSLVNLVCRLLLEKKNIVFKTHTC